MARVAAVAIACAMLPGELVPVRAAVLCAEDVASIRPEQIGPATAQTFLGRYVIDEYQRACALWPHAKVSPDFSQPVTASVPTLLVSGLFDPVTPSSFAEHVARTLTGSRHLVWSFGAHGSVTGCALPAALHVLRTGTLAGMPEVCGSSPITPPRTNWK